MLNRTSQPAESVKRILGEAQDGAFIVGPCGLISLWNRSAERILGWSAGEAIGLSCADVLPGAACLDRGLCRESSHAVDGSRACNGSRRLELRTQTKGGRPVWLDVTAIEVPSDNGGKPVTAHLFRDVSATRELIGRLPRPPAAAMPAASVLSPREHEVLALMATGANTRALAERLEVSPATIRNHVQSLFAKLGVHSRLEAVAWMNRQAPQPMMSRSKT